MEVVEVYRLRMQEAIRVHLRLLQQNLRAFSTNLRVLRVWRRIGFCEPWAARSLQIHLVNGVVSHCNINWRRSGRLVSESNSFPALRDNIRRVDDLAHRCVLSASTVLSPCLVWDRTTSHSRHIELSLLLFTTR